MKTTIKSLAVLLFIFTAISINAQTYKFGHIDYQNLIKTLPETSLAQKELEAESKSVQEMLETMQVEGNNKVNDIVENDKLPKGNPKKWSSIVRNQKEKEVQEMSQKIQQFQVTAQRDLQKKEMELLQPIQEKVNAAIKTVAKENKFTYIFHLSTLLYHSDDSIDITSMVKAKLTK